MSLPQNEPVLAAKHYLPLLGEELKRRGNKPELELKTLPDISEKLWGIGTRELMVIGARTSQGKTTFSLQVCMDLASQGIPCVYLSLEMTKLSILERLFCNYCNIHNDGLKRGGFMNYQNEWKVFCDQINKIPLIITEGIGKSWSQIDALIERMNPKPKVIILDYIQCVSGSGFEKREVIDEYIRHFRQMAIEYNFAAIICSQINRAGASEDGSLPDLHNLKGTGYLEELADKILLLHYPYFYNHECDPNEYILRLAKNRNGRTGMSKLRFIPEYFKFEDEGKVVSSAVVDEALEVFGGRAFEQTDVRELPQMRV